MTVVRDDFTFADIINEPPFFTILNWTHTIMPFGMAGDCSAKTSEIGSCPRTGHFIIDLIGTGLRVDKNVCT